MFVKKEKYFFLKQEYIISRLEKQRLILWQREDKVPEAVTQLLILVKEDKSTQDDQVVTVFQEFFRFFSAERSASWETQASGDGW